MTRQSLGCASSQMKDKQINMTRNVLELTLPHVLEAVTVCQQTKSHNGSKGMACVCVFIVAKRWHSWPELVRQAVPEMSCRRQGSAQCPPGSGR